MVANKPSRALAAPVIVGFAAFSPLARASGLDAPLVGSGQSGPTTVDAAAVHWNPGALGMIDSLEVLTGGGLVAGRVGYQRERRGVYQRADGLRYQKDLSPADIDPRKTGWAAPVSATPLAPTADLFVASPLGDKRVVVGLGAYVPYAAALDFPENGPQAYQLRDAFIVATHVSGSLAARVLPNLSIGASVTWVSGLASLTKLQDFAATEDFRRAFTEPPIAQPNAFGPAAPTSVRELDVLSRPISITNAVSNGFSFNAGLLYQPTPALRLGLAYQHGAPMVYRGRFALDMNDDFFTHDLAAQGLKYPPLVQGDAEIRFRLPRRITAGAALALGRGLSFDGFVSYVLYSDLDSFVVSAHSPDLAQPALGIGETVKVVLPRAWKDTLWVEASARAAVSPILSLSATAGYQSPASPDATIDVGSPDGHRFIGGLGAVVHASRSVDLQADARLSGILPRTVTTSQYDLGNGRYTMVVGYLGGHALARF